MLKMDLVSMTLFQYFVIDYEIMGEKNLAICIKLSIKIALVILNQLSLSHQYQYLFLHKEISPLSSL